MASFEQLISDAPLSAPSQLLSSALGATVVDGGVCFAVFSAHATAVDVCIFDEDDQERRFQLNGPDKAIWKGFIPGIGAGTRYGYRFYGPWDPANGHVFNPYKLTIDPYAKALSGTVEHRPEIYPHAVTDDLVPAGHPLVPSKADSAAFTAKSIVVAPGFELHPGPQTAWRDTVIYETHAKGFTKLMPGVPAELQGTYAGLASPTAISYLQNLGITAVELLPIHAILDEPFLSQRGLSNYWGYSTLNYFSPEPSYASQAAQEAGPQAVIDEFRGMVSILHEAGIEVILDVVYNHTCEGSPLGSSLSWRGADNATYYLHDPSSPADYIDVTGTGNSLDFTNPIVVQMTLDSLRYWATEMGIDGFRFDLGVTLGRAHGVFNRQHPFLVAAAADPALAAKKLIMEPWDVGFDGWHTGDFPVPFASWNDRFRDSVRDFWVANVGTAAHGNQNLAGQSNLATRLAGSADTYYRDPNGIIRDPLASVNFVTAHDGFTMADLVSYDRKHNEANRENNRDGSDNNRSWNHGAEGPVITRSKATELHPDSGIFAEILPARERSIRNLFATLVLAAGVPMITAGDEFGRTQRGNNNAYCQDNEISWLDWDWEDWQGNLHSMVKHLLKLRSHYRVMRPEQFAIGKPWIPELDHPDVAWFDALAHPMEGAADWNNPANRLLQMHRCSCSNPHHDMLMIVNGTLNEATVKLALPSGKLYRMVWDSSWTTPQDGGFAPGSIDLDDTYVTYAGKTLPVEPLSITVLISEGPVQ
ncbi:glycogen debranching enzyme GlgX [Boudabousia marimammalium]|uniref:Glycogen debranching enzyme GlgX n=2 Tax=Boudabousia marimammalium TaxID=156892 RepID=A0A1Q5PS87_9ACTO|nr:glycogen debranching enzyme GlgX [Boudabousia marimammalium]